MRQALYPYLRIIKQLDWKTDNNVAVKLANWLAQKGM